MSEPPDHRHNLSLRLSEVLDDIGVNETLVKKTQGIWMLAGTIRTIREQLDNHDLTIQCFGSRIEASTTIGLYSDKDLLICHNQFLVIQDLSHWQPNKTQFLMVQDETTSPGYCLLQAVRDDCPMPMKNISGKHLFTDIRGRVLVKHSVFRKIPDSIQHGPANLVRRHNEVDVDFVEALRCSSWPREADSWLQQTNESGWPTPDLKSNSAKQGCFIVPVSSRADMYQDLEYRISTSFVERNLMHSLNITQLRCYILMKMILKTFLKPKFNDTVTSFMCKNILFYCIAGSEGSSTWNEGSLLSCLIKCLETLLQCIKIKNCPHFMIPKNNLLAGKLSEEVKDQLMEVVSNLIGNIDQSLLGIQIDDLGLRLHVKSGTISDVFLANDIALNRIFMPKLYAYNTANFNISTVGYHVKDNITFIQKKMTHRRASVNFRILKQNMSKLNQLQLNSNKEEQVAIRLQKLFLYTIAGSIQASEDIRQNRAISPKALQYFRQGLESDVFSSKLKLASAHYCSGDFESCGTILGDLSEQVSQTTVRDLCDHRRGSLNYSLPNFGKICFEKNENAITQNLAFCIAFLRCEVNCIPVELKYEMFRYTAEDRPYRKNFEDWMDFAVVDSLPYLYFLQYKVYRHLNRPEQCITARNNLIQCITAPNNLLQTIENELSNLGHKETAWNLLGQCIEQENKNQSALLCFCMSLKVRQRNNAAKWHLCKMLARLIRERT